jgi:Fe-S-cluster containining protein
LNPCSFSLDIPKMQTLFKCRTCGECCRQLFGKRFGAAIAGWEKARLEQLAKRLGVTVDFFPLTKSLTGQVTTWQFSDAKCPFLNVHSGCMIYKDRPLLCRAYPLMPYGVGYCVGLEAQSRRFVVKYTPEQVAAGQAYMLQVASLIKSAVWLYNVNKRRWELNVHV